MNPRREPWATPEYEERRKAHRATFKPRKDADIAAHVLAALDVGAAWWAELYLRKQWRRLEPTTRWRLRASLAPHMVGTVWPFAKRQAVALLQLRDDGRPRPLLRDRALPVAIQVQSEHPDLSLSELHAAVKERLGEKRFSKSYLRQFIEDGHLHPTPEMLRRKGVHKQS